jgi:hypothetical protein
MGVHSYGFLARISNMTWILTSEVTMTLALNSNFVFPPELFFDYSCIIFHQESKFNLRFDFRGHHDVANASVK